jgi:hypothetical protein
MPRARGKKKEQIVTKPHLPRRIARPPQAAQVDEPRLKSRPRESDQTIKAMKRLERRIITAIPLMGLLIAAAITLGLEVIGAIDIIDLKIHSVIAAPVDAKAERSQSTCVPNQARSEKPRRGHRHTRHGHRSENHSQTTVHNTRSP